MKTTSSYKDGTPQAKLSNMVYHFLLMNKAETDMPIVQCYFQKIDV